MSPILEKAISKLRACPEWEQEEIAHHILEEIEDYASSPLTEEQKSELDRRIAESDAHPERLIPADAVFERLRARWSRP